VATRIYGAGRVDFGPKARADLKTIADLGLTELPICIAKTQYSFSDNPALLGRPRDFVFAVREIEIAAGAGSSSRSRARSCACPACRKFPRPSTSTSTPTATSPG
jgi:formyltetrahydrofolate synthetase